MEKKNPVQASEKLYKAVKECIKALAKTVKTPQLKEAEKRGKWNIWLLGRASTDISKVLKEDKIRLAWTMGLRHPRMGASTKQSTEWKM